MKAFALIFILNMVEALVDNVMSAKASTSFIVPCPIECGKPRPFDRNCHSCYTVESTTIQDAEMLLTSTTVHNKMSCLYWQQVCIKDCSKKKPTAKEPPSAYEIYLCEDRCRADWYCFLERYDAEHNQRRLFETSNSID